MSLRSDVESLRDATVVSLAAAHDHFVYTKKVWRIVHVEVRRRGRKIALKNRVTGSSVTEQDLAPVAQAAVNDYLPAATIQQLASVTESFLTDLVRLWLTAFPFHFKGQKLEAQEIIAARDKAAMLRLLTDQYVLSMSYKRPSEWFKQVSGIFSMNHPTEQEIEQFAEFKATRDIFVHNRGIATDIYLEKAGRLARAAIGRPLDLSDAYLHDAWRLCRKIAVDVGTDAAAKA